MARLITRVTESSRDKIALLYAAQTQSAPTAMPPPSQPSSTPSALRHMYIDLNLNTLFGDCAVYMRDSTVDKDADSESLGKDGRKIVTQTASFIRKQRRKGSSAEPMRRYVLVGSVPIPPLSIQGLRYSPFRLFVMFFSP